MAKGNKEREPLFVRMVHDIWSALAAVVPAARWKDLAAVAKNGDTYLVISSEEASADAILALQKFETVVIIIQGKPTKLIISAEERDYLTQQIRASNAWMN